MTQPDIAQQLEAPLAVLKAISEGAFGAGQTSSQSQLQVQLGQLQSAVGDVLDIAAKAMSDLLEQVEDEMELPEDALAVLKTVSEDLEDQLGILSDALLGARNFEELGAAREEVEAVQLAMQATLGRLEVLLDSLGDERSMVPPAEDSRMEEASAVLELLAAALESIDGHLSDGDLGHLRNALAVVEEAAEILRGALTQE